MTVNSIYIKKNLSQRVCDVHEELGSSILVQDNFTFQQTQMDFSSRTPYSYPRSLLSALWHSLYGTNILLTHATCAHTSIEVSFIIFSNLMFSFLGFSEFAFVHSGVVNGLSRLVSVSRHFLIDTNGLYITHMMCANTWKSQLKCRSFFFIAKHTSLFQI